MKRYDVAVIGSGSGLMVVEAALDRGLRCAIVEKSKFGGTCLNRGCIPSKMLVYPADLIREVQDAERVGVHYGHPVIDWSTIERRVWKQIDYNAQIEKSLLETPGLDVFRGAAEFMSAHGMRVRENGAVVAEFEADWFVIAAGARTLIPPVEGLADAGYVTAESFFGEKFPEKPWESLVIIGGGAIGAEFAHVFSAFGTKVTLTEMRERILPTEEEVSAFVERQLRKNGIEVATGARVIKAETGASGKVVIIEDIKTGARRTIEAEEIFVSAGLRSNADLLNLPAAGVSTDARGWIPTNEYLETSQEHIYAIGDINGKFQFRHTANYEATVLSENLFGGARRAVSYEATPWAVFTWPQVGHVGLTEREAREKGLKIGVARNRYSSIAGGIAMGISRRSEDDGFAKIILTEDLQIVGAHIAGPHAAMLVQPFVYLMNAEAPCIPGAGESALGRRIREVCPQIGSVRPMLDSMVIHPSLNELAAWAIEDVVWDTDA